MSLNELQNPFTRRQFLPNTMNYHGIWNNTTQYYKFDVVVCPTAISSYILVGREALIGGGDPSLNPDWEELSQAATGVLSLTVGAGLQNTNTPTNPNLVNTGVLSLTAGTGLANTNTPTAPNLVNTGILGITQGTGIGVVFTNTQNPTINNTGLVGLTATSGVVSSGGSAPTITNTQKLKRYNPPSPFVGSGSYAGSSAYTIGNFTIPADAVPNSSALLYSQGYSVNGWSPSLPMNLMDFRFGFSPTPAVPIAGWFEPAVGGFLVQPGNSNNVPQPIPLLPHTPANINNPDYVNLPTWILLDNITPGQTIYANIEIPYPGDSISGVSMYAPILMYHAQ
jgi:hypothetical protein